MSKIGYIRVSTEHQETARQQEIMCDYQVDRIFSEKLSGANTDRPQLRAMLDYVREGDTLYVESISRLGRSTKDLLNIIDTLTDKGVTLISHKEKIDTNTPTGKFMLTVFAALSQLEREQLKQRQREGIEIAKAQGKYTGRKPLPTDWTRFGQLYGEWKSKSITGRDFMRRMDMSANTVTLCGEWICRQTLFTDVCVSMNSVTASPSRPQLDRQRNETAPQHRPSLRSRKLTAEKKKPSETLTERFRELAVIRFNRVYACCGMLHNADYGII